MDIDSYYPSTAFVQDLYARMLIMRIVDEYICALHRQGQIGFVASCRGHEAAQVGSAVCIEVGKDFTLPYDRDLGVVLTIGMTPYEIFRTYIQTYRKQMQAGRMVYPAQEFQAAHQWGYQKHNMVAGAAPVATQILHAAGIAFASKLRKASAVTVAYCGDDAIAEPDFLEGITFSAHHTLPAIYIYERDTSYSRKYTESDASPLQTISLPMNIDYHCIDGSDVLAVNTAMHAAMRHTHEGLGPVLLEIQVCRHGENEPASPLQSTQFDPLLRCQRYLEEHGIWDEDWATQLRERIIKEVEQAVQDALRDG
ncbi:MAG TPA: thiamine pyrophosphate-dependent enzyme [Ktedonobacteraceae bacterium]|nr:thiamine pyrophosphate-dependent enzyme [Ktedonobacteraceae bacterium]